MAVKGEVIVARPSRRVSRRFSLRVKVVYRSGVGGEEGGRGAAEDGMDDSSASWPELGGSEIDWLALEGKMEGLFVEVSNGMVSKAQDLPTGTHLLRRNENHGGGRLHRRECVP